jgi:hypothetical protein
LAIAENLFDAANLFENQSVQMKLNEFEMQNNFDSIYTILMRSINLLIELYVSDNQKMKTISQIHQVLANYGAAQLMKIDQENKKLYHKMTFVVFKNLKSKLARQAKLKFRSLKYEQVNQIIQLIHVIHSLFSCYLNLNFLIFLYCIN